MIETGLLPFEESIIREFKPPEGEAPGFYGKGKMKPRLGHWIKAHLQEQGEDYPYRMWKLWNNLCITANALGVMIPTNNYTQFVIYMRCCQLAKLIKQVRKVPYRVKYDPEHTIYITYYSVIEENIDSDLWDNPRKESESYRTWSDLSREQKEKYYKSRKLKAAIRYARRYGIPLEQVPRELRGRRGLIPRLRE